MHSWLISIWSAGHQWLIHVSAPFRVRSVPGKGAAGMGSQEWGFGSTPRWGRQEACSLPNQLKKWWTIAIQTLVRPPICNESFYFCSSIECWCNHSNPVMGLQLKSSRESAEQESLVPYTHSLKNQTAIYHISSYKRTFYMLSWQCKLKHAAMMPVLFCHTCLSSAALVHLFPWIKESSTQFLRENKATITVVVRIHFVGERIDEGVTERLG